MHISEKSCNFAPKFENYCIMKRLVYIFIASVLCVMAQAQESRLELFNQVYNADSLAPAKTLLDEWASTGEKDGGYYACQFNYYLNQGMKSGIQMSKELPLYVQGEKALTLTDTVTGGIAGYVYQGYSIADSALLNTAYDWIKRGINACPNRLDLYFGLATSYLYCDQTDQMILVLEQVMKQETKNKRKWLWLENEQLADTVDMVYMRIQEDFSRFLDAERLNDAERLTTLAIKYYPKRAEYVNNMAVICYMRNDYKQAMKYFKKALKLNPGDELIKANIEYLEDVLKNAK